MNDAKQAFAERLNKALDDKGFPERGRARLLAQEFKISDKGAGKWIKGDSIPETWRITSIAEWLGVSGEWLLTGKERSTEDILASMGAMGAITTAELTDEERNQKVWLDVYDVRFCSGDGASVEFHFDTLIKKALPFEADFFTKRGVHPKNVRLIYNIGDSNEPYLFDGDLCAIDISATVIKDGERYALYFEGEAMIKQIFKEEGGVIRLHSLNPKYNDKIVTNQNGESFKIIGRQFYRSG